MDDLERLTSIVWLLYGCLLVLAMVALTEDARKPYCAQHHKPVDQCKDEHR
jgi:hypothetical protein